MASISLHLQEGFSQTIASQSKGISPREPGIALTSVFLHGFCLNRYSSIPSYLTLLGMLSDLFGQFSCSWSTKERSLYKLLHLLLLETLVFRNNPAGEGNAEFLPDLS